MEIVGDYLVQAVSKIEGAVDQDLFGRSAFNRYYYAAFLRVRSLFAEIDDKLNEPQHGQIPDLLTVTLRGRVNKIIKRQEKGGILSPEDAQGVRDQLDSSLKTLADLMRYAYSIRKIADYEPDIKIDLVDGNLGIGGCDSAAARKWGEEVMLISEQIREIWRGLGN
ncbi:hypothetical protein [Burkholderia anthina]|uniref:HEPN domain-containing protein n=1 Tax=Burkholderia anthina TaxID=179879 RepID=A0ABS2AYT3_9BURK|nr:hypothetical protein [Burkholderia anthina]MBM2765234.1 hypothetical protein [Burkholderia anthina]